VPPPSEGAQPPRVANVRRSSASATRQTQSVPRRDSVSRKPASRGASPASVAPPRRGQFAGPVLPDDEQTRSSASSRPRCPRMSASPAAETPRRPSSVPLRERGDRLTISVSDLPMELCREGLHSQGEAREPAEARARGNMSPSTVPIPAPARHASGRIANPCSPIAVSGVAAAQAAPQHHPGGRTNRVVRPLSPNSVSPPRVERGTPGTPRRPVPAVGCDPASSRATLVPSSRTHSRERKPEPPAMRRTLHANNAPGGIPSHVPSHVPSQVPSHVPGQTRNSGTPLRTLGRAASRAAAVRLQSPSKSPPRERTSVSLPRTTPPPDRTARFSRTPQMVRQVPGGDGGSRGRVGPSQSRKQL